MSSTSGSSGVSKCSCHKVVHHLLNAAELTYQRDQLSVIHSVFRCKARAMVSAALSRQRQKPTTSLQACTSALTCTPCSSTIFLCCRRTVLCDSHQLLHSPSHLPGASCRRQLCISHCCYRRQRKSSEALRFAHSCDFCSRSHS